MTQPAASRPSTRDRSLRFWDVQSTLPVWTLGVAVAVAVVLIAWGAAQVNDRFARAPLPTPGALENPFPILAPESARRGEGGITLTPRPRVVPGADTQGSAPMRAR
jgi:hypothetical protein